MTTEQMYRELLRASDVPDGLHDGLVVYLAYGYPPGSFLRAVLENKLLQAVSAADENSARGLVSLVRWLYNAAPAVSWGSVDNVNEWMAARRQEREKVSA